MDGNHRKVQDDAGGIGVITSTVILCALQHEVMLRSFRIHEGISNAALQRY